MRLSDKFQSLLLVAASSACAGTSNLLLYTSWLWERIDMARPFGAAGELLLLSALLLQPWVLLAHWVGHSADGTGPDSSLAVSTAFALISSLILGTVVSRLTRKFPRIYWPVTGMLMFLAASMGLYYLRDVSDIRALVGL